MGLYNLVHGTSTLAPIVLCLLDKTPADFGRFRDAYVQDGLLVVHTRCGGGNREDYEVVFDVMRTHPLYVEDRDDCDFDCTYADIKFRFPERDRDELPAAWIEGSGGEAGTAWELVDKLRAVPNMAPSGERWNAAIESIKAR